MTNAEPSKKDKIIKYSSLFVLVLQNTSLVLFMKYAMTGNRPKFLKTMSVFFAEVFKLLVCVCLVIIQQRSIVKAWCQIWDQFYNHWQDTLKVMVPALVYTIQNILLYVAVDNLSPATYMVTYQLKILTTAGFTVCVLKRKLSIRQWIALIFLFAGVVVVQIDQKTSTDREKALKALAEISTTTTALPPTSSLDTVMEQFMSSTPSNETAPELPDFDWSTAAPTAEAFARAKREIKEQNPIVGFIAVIIACCLSGFAGIYFEKILKGSNVSIWIRNIQLALPSILFALGMALVKDSSAVFSDNADIFTNLLQGFDWAVWVTVSISAFGGLVVAVVIKYADNILKAFATSFAIVLNCVLAVFLFDFRPTPLFIVGATFVIGAVFVYSMYPYRAHQPVPTECPEDGNGTNQELKLVLGSPTEKA